MRAHMLSWLGLLLLLGLLSFGLLSTVTTLNGKAGTPPFAMKTVYYLPGDAPTHMMDLYIPQTAKKPMPVILWIHGGAWVMGSKADTPAAYFMDSGFAVASINYRFSKEAIFPAQLDDCKAAVRWLRAHASEYGFAKIGAFGHSAGGHLVSLLGTTGGMAAAEGKLGDLKQSSTVQAVCDWCGPTDLLTIGQQAEKNNTLRLNDPEGPVAKLLGGLPNTRKELAYQASPVNFASQDDPPFLIMHGDADDVVPIGQSKELYKALQDAHVKVEYKIINGAGHNFLSHDTLQTVDDFFKKTLR